MGLLGKYYDQTREGKGVSKSDRRDKGLFNFFDVYTTNFWKLTLLALMWLLFSLPVVTMPAATCAFVYVIRNMVRNKGVFRLRRHVHEVFLEVSAARDSRSRRIRAFLHRGALVRNYGRTVPV